MIELTDKQVANYFHRSYKTVDGLWFLKVEEKYGFDTALEIDNEVWKILPKIQARLLSSMGKTKKGINGLLEILEKKLTLEGFIYEINKYDRDNGFEIVVSQCPWHKLMVKSEREQLAEKVGNTICNTEYAAWASEFGDTIRFKLTHTLCSGEKHCVLQFILSEND